MYILALDQGNTTLSAGIYKDDTLISKKHRRTRRHDLDYETIVTALLQEMYSCDVCFSGIGVSCSAPYLREFLASAVKKIFSCEPIEISSSLKSGITCRDSGLAEISPDLLAAAQGAISLYGGNIVVVSLGTTTTFTYIDDNGCIDGVVISPGLGISLQALKRCTPHLPMVSFSFPSSVLGQDTVSAVSSGVFWGHLSMIESILEKLKKQTGRDFRTVLCGGHTRIMQAEAAFIDYFEPDLVLYGTQLLCRLNLGSAGV